VVVGSSKIKGHNQSALAGARLAGQSYDGSKKVILSIQSRQQPIKITGSVKHPILHVVNSSSTHDPIIADGIEV
jgi:hypothetical protein